MLEKLAFLKVQVFCVAHWRIASKTKDFGTDIFFCLFESTAADIFIFSLEKVKGNATLSSSYSMSSTRCRQNENKSQRKQRQKCGHEEFHLFEINAQSLSLCEAKFKFENEQRWDMAFYSDTEQLKYLSCGRVKRKKTLKEKTTWNR